MNSGTLRTFLSDITPCQIPLNVLFTLLYILSFLISRYIDAIATMPQMAVTNQPVGVKRWKMPSMLVPVSAKKVLNTRIWQIKVKKVIISTRRESMARSVTTVPNDFGKVINLII